jgi:hypothetical protein
MSSWIKKALTRRISVKHPRSKRRWQIEVEPSTGLVYSMYFAITALISLTLLEAMYILVLRSFSTEIFSAITLLIGTILGAFFGKRG